MLSLKEFYQQKRDLLKINRSLQFKISKRIGKFSLLKKIYIQKKNPIAFRTVPSLKKNLVLQKRENQAILHVRSSFNNIIVALTSLKGKVLFVQSAGSCGFQGKKKRSTKFAMRSTLNSVVELARDQNLKGIFLCLKGFSHSRHFVLKSLKQNNLKLLGVRDVTPNPHNGCRPKKLRRG